MRFPSNKTLGKVVVYGAMASISAVMYMRFTVQDKIRKSPYYRKALESLRQHKGASSLLGPPIKETGFDLTDPNNASDGQKAQFEVSVKGSKDRGTMFFWATLNTDEGWILDRLELEVKSQPDKRFILKKTQENQQNEIEQST